MSTTRRTGYRSACALALSPLIVLASSGNAIAKDDIRTAIQHAGPSVYWPMEHSLRPGLAPNESAADALTLNALERGGPTLDFDLFVSNQYTGVPYLPLRPDHTTCAQGTTALAFGETLREPSGYEFDTHRRASRNEFSGLGASLVGALGIADSWSMHLIAYPEPDPQHRRGEETLVRLRSGDAQLSVSCVTAEDEAVYAVVLTRGGDVMEAMVTGVPIEGHRGHQIVVTFQDAGVDTLTLRVEEHSGSFQGRFDMPASGSQRIDIGGTPDAGGAYFGAMHHLAFFDRVLSGSDIEALRDAKHTPETREPLTIDWDAPPHFLVWAQPMGAPDPQTWNTGLPLTDWDADIWEMEGVYPMVRIWRPQYYNDASYLAEKLAQRAEHTNTSLGLLHNRKSLADGPGFSVFLQQWGCTPGDLSGEEFSYADHGDLRWGLMRNWRDTPRNWRQNVSHHGARFEHPAISTADIELLNPYYREGMSMNAFVTADVFRHVASQLEGRGLPMPTRLHWDLEGAADRASATISADVMGWYMDCALDGRAGDGRFWSSDEHTLANIAHEPVFDRYLYDPANMPWAYSAGFIPHAYDHALYNALTVPVEDALGVRVRTSEYNLRASGEFLPLDGFGRYDQTMFTHDNVKACTIGNSKHYLVGANFVPRYADFSAPVCYPLRRDHTIGSIEDVRAYWGLTGARYTLLSSDSGVNATRDEAQEDLDNLYVEVRKHEINASYLATRTGAPGEGDSSTVKPIAPWLPYPGVGFDANGSTVHHHKQVFVNYDDDSGNPMSYRARWPEVARIAVFAHRRGSREFILWGGSLESDPRVASDLEHVVAAVHAVHDNWLDFTSTHALSREAHATFGVPDGVVDHSDYRYFLARWHEGDPEADITGCDGRPDGVVDKMDLMKFVKAFREAVINGEAHGCIADFDGDGEVDLSDFGIFGQRFGRLHNTPGADPGCGSEHLPVDLADLDADGDVDLADFGVFGQEFGTQDCND